MCTWVSVVYSNMHSDLKAGYPSMHLGMGVCIPVCTRAMGSRQGKWITGVDRGLDRGLWTFACMNSGCRRVCTLPLETANYTVGTYHIGMHSCLKKYLPFVLICEELGQAKLWVKVSERLWGRDGAVSRLLPAYQREDLHDVLLSYQLLFPV